jgi:ADP-ribose pyrophosphatase YjhB (NUDIX family)
MPIPSINLVIRRNNKLLLIKRTNEPELGKWWVPGCRIFKHESLEHAARRKAEQLGITIQSITQSETHEYIRHHYHHISTVFIIEPKEISLPDNVEYQWIDTIENVDSYVRDIILKSHILEIHNP